MQAAAVEILGGLAVEVERLLAALRHAHHLGEPGAIGIAVLAEPRHLLPEALHDGLGHLVAVVGEVAEHVVHLGRPAPRLHRAGAGNPDRRMRLLDRPRPDVDVALLVEAAVEGERVLLLPGAQDEVVRLVVALAQLARVGAVGVGGVHRRAHREAGDQPAARDAVDHGELLRHARRRVIEREAVAEHADRRAGGAPRQRRGDQVRRRHQAVAVGMMLVAADRIEAALRRVFELVEELVVHAVRALRVEQRGVDVDPDRGVPVLEVVRQLLVGHQVEPEELHGSALPSAQRLLGLPPAFAGVDPTYGGCGEPLKRRLCTPGLRACPRGSGNSPRFERRDGQSRGSPFRMPLRAAWKRFQGHPRRAAIRVPNRP